MGLWKDIFHTDINKREEELLPWEKSHRFIDMTQSEFDKAYDLSIESAINSGRINNYQEGVVVAFLSYFHAIDKLSDLYELRKHFIQGCNYVENGKCGEPLNDIVEFFEHEFNLKKKVRKDINLITLY